MSSFQAFSCIVSRCQQDGVVPDVEAMRLRGLIYAVLHGAIDLELGGRASGSKGAGSIKAMVNLLFDLLASTPRQAIVLGTA